MTRDQINLLSFQNLANEFTNSLCTFKNRFIAGSEGVNRAADGIDRFGCDDGADAFDADSGEGVNEIVVIAFESATFVGEPSSADLEGSEGGDWIAWGSVTIGCQGFLLQVSF
jgi:hypothetical protein